MENSVIVDVDLRYEGNCGRLPQPMSVDDLSFVETLPRLHNNPGEVERIVDAIAIRKITTPWLKTLFLGMLAGLFVSLAGMFMVQVAGGTPAEFRKLYPFVPKLLICLTFPIGIIFIVLFGGELFTGTFGRNLAQDRFSRSRDHRQRDDHVFGMVGTQNHDQGAGVELD